MILEDTHLRIGVVLELVFVTIEMIGSDIEEYSDIGMEVIHVIQLETTQLYDVVIMRIFGHLKGQTPTDIACQSDIISRRFEDMKDERSGRGFAITARDTHHFGPRIASRKLYFADDMRALSHEFAHHRRLFRNTGTLDYFVGIEDFGFRVLPFFPRNAVVVEEFFIFILNLRHVRNEHLETFFASQNGCSGTAFTGT